MGGIAAKDLPPRSLALIPFGEISDTRPSSSGASLILEVQGRKTTQWILRPPDFKTKSFEFEAESGETIMQRVICPYWWCVDRADLLSADTPATLTKVSGTIEVPLGHWKTNVKELRAVGGGGALKITTRFLTNPGAVKAGAWLFHSASK